MATNLTKNPLHTLVGYQLRRASAATMDELAKELVATRLRPSEASILLVVKENPMIKPSEVGRELGVKSANMAPLVAALERTGLIEREPVDGRSQGLTLTAAGRDAAELAFQIMQRHDKRLMERIGLPSTDDLANSLSRLWRP